MDRSVRSPALNIGTILSIINDSMNVLHILPIVTLGTILGQNLGQIRFTGPPDLPGLNPFPREAR